MWHGFSQIKQGIYALFVMPSAGGKSVATKFGEDCAREAVVRSSMYLNKLFDPVFTGGTVQGIRAHVSSCQGSAYACHEEFISGFGSCFADEKGDSQERADVLTLLTPGASSKSVLATKEAPSFRTASVSGVAGIQVLILSHEGIASWSRGLVRFLCYQTSRLQELFTTSRALRSNDGIMLRVNMFICAVIDSKASEV